MADPTSSAARGRGLWIAGRNQSKLLEQALRQAAALQSATKSAEEALTAIGSSTVGRPADGGQ